LSRSAKNLLGSDHQVEPFSERFPWFSLAEAYDIAARVGDLRRARGESPIGRKIGFTNRSIWGDLGISAPVWNYVFDSTVSNGVVGQNRVGLSGMPEPRIEPEVVLHLASVPAVGMTKSELMDCIDWIAPGFEVVYSIFPNWAFTAADAAAAYGVHGALILGERLDVTGTRAERMTELSAFVVKLESDGGARRKGHVPRAPSQRRCRLAPVRPGPHGSKR